MSVADGASTFTLRARKTEQEVAIADIHRIDVNKGWLWAAVQIQTKDGVVPLHGLSQALSIGTPAEMAEFRIALLAAMA